MPGDGMASYVSQRGRKPAWRRAARPSRISVPSRLWNRDDEFELESEDSGDESSDDSLRVGLAGTANLATANPPPAIPATLSLEVADDTDTEPDTPTVALSPAAPVQAAPSLPAPAPPVAPPIVTLTPVAPSRQTRSTTAVAAPPTTVAAPPAVSVQPQPVVVVETTRVVEITETREPPSPSSTSISFMTTGFAALPTIEPSAPRKELEPLTRTLTGTVISAVLPTETLSTLPGQASGTNDRDRIEDARQEAREDEDYQSRVDATTQHVLIGVGSIGAFIFACFLGWVFWRVTRKSRRRRRDSLQTSSQIDFGNAGASGGLASKIPFLRNLGGGGWQNLGGERQTELPPTYEKGQPLRLDTGYYTQNGLVFESNRNMPPGGAYLSPIEVSPTSTITMRRNTMDGGLDYSRVQSRGQSVSLTSIVANYANGTDPNLTLRSGVTTQGTFLNQSELARQPSNAYDPTRRQVSRASELSSISSGFGDADIIVPGMPRQPAPASQAMRTSQNGVGRSSWMSRGIRDTVYTEHSEDLPPRFRTVNSWVNQQTGRINRAQDKAEREASDIPPVPGLPAGTGRNGMPPEQEFTMMMPDGQIPRRADDMGTR